MFRGGSLQAIIGVNLALEIVLRSKILRRNRRSGKAIAGLRYVPYKLRNTNRGSTRSKASIPIVAESLLAHGASQQDVIAYGCVYCYEGE